MEWGLTSVTAGRLIKVGYYCGRPFHWDPTTQRLVHVRSTWGIIRWITGVFVFTLIKIPLILIVTNQLVFRQLQLSSLPHLVAVIYLAINLTSTMFDCHTAYRRKEVVPVVNAIYSWLQLNTRKSTYLIWCYKQQNILCEYRNIVSRRSKEEELDVHSFVIPPGDNCHDRSLIYIHLHSILWPTVPGSLITNMFNRGSRTIWNIPYHSLQYLFGSSHVCRPVCICPPQFLNLHYLPRWLRAFGNNGCILPKSTGVRRYLLSICIKTVCTTKIPKFVEF